MGRIGGRAGRGKARNQRVGCQPIQKAIEVTTSSTRQSSPPTSCTKTTSPTEETDDTEGSEKKEGSEETEELEDSYYYPCL